MKDARNAGKTKPTETLTLNRGSLAIFSVFAINTQNHQRHDIVIKEAAGL